jgi:hypothetical protein
MAVRPNLTRRPAAFTTHEDSWCSFLLRGWVDPSAIVRLEGLGKLKKSNDLIGNRTRDLPACSILPQTTTLPRAPLSEVAVPQTSWETAEKHDISVKMIGFWAQKSPCDLLKVNHKCQRLNRNNKFFIMLTSSSILMIVSYRQEIL